MHLIVCIAIEQLSQLRDEIAGALVQGFESTAALCLLGQCFDQTEQLVAQIVEVAHRGRVLLDQGERSARW